MSHHINQIRSLKINPMHLYSWLYKRLLQMRDTTFIWCLYLVGSGGNCRQNKFISQTKARTNKSMTDQRSIIQRKPNRKTILPTNKIRSAQLYILPENLTKKKATSDYSYRLKQTDAQILLIDHRDHPEE